MTPRSPSSDEAPVQLPLFQAAPTTAGARLAQRIKAWLAGDAPSHDVATQPASLWPDSFFDGDGRP